MPLRRRCRGRVRPRRHPCRIGPCRPARRAAGRKSPQRPARRLHAGRRRHPCRLLANTSVSRASVPACLLCALVFACGSPPVPVVPLGPSFSFRVPPAPRRNPAASWPPAPHPAPAPRCPARRRSTASRPPPLRGVPPAAAPRRSHDDERSGAVLLLRTDRRHEERRRHGDCQVGRIVDEESRRRRLAVLLLGGTPNSNCPVSTRGSWSLAAVARGLLRV